DSLREEVNAAGVRVLSLFLGRTASPMQASVHEMERRKYNPELLMQPEDAAAVVINALTLPRTAEVTEVSKRPLVKSYKSRRQIGTETSFERTDYESGLILWWLRDAHPRFGRRSEANGAYRPAANPLARDEILRSLRA